MLDSQEKEINVEMKNKLLSFMKEDAYKPLSYNELVQEFQRDFQQVSEFEEVLNSLLEDGSIIITRKNKYGVTEKMNLVPGRIQGNKKGFGFLIPDNKEICDLFIPAENLNGAMHNDRVIVRLTAGELGTKKSEGEVIKILKRSNERVVGTFENGKGFGFVVPDDPRIYQDIFVSKADFNSAKDGHKVVVEITKWPEGRRNPEGIVVEVLGHKDDIGTDIISIIRGHNLPEEFPSEVEEQAGKIPERVAEADIEKRRDLRGKVIVTIDGDDAKDLDDAVSLEMLPNGNFLLGVHIADVTQYVFENSYLDKEALKRGTSVYLVDRVVPMLPRRLSNGICSLNPQIERLTLSCDMEIDKRGKVKRYEIYESVIKTKERMSYKNVNKILTDNDSEVIERYSDLVDTFKQMEELMKILSKRRRTRGSIDFEFEEAKIILDEKGKPIDIRPYERGVSERIIEEFMLVCNETIAEDMYWKELPFVYRVHEDPNAEKLQAFNEFIFNFGYHLKGLAEIHPKALQQLTDQIKGTKEERIINTLMLRSLKKARYTSTSMGHFGLAAKYYCHFTSPIRRYPDLMIHRIIKEDIHGKLTEKRVKHLQSIIEGIAEQSSIRERAADEAERAVEDLKKAEYMKDRIGEEYDGIISNVTSFGMFVELENTIEGLVHMSNMEDDYYQYDEVHHTLIGERKRKTFRIGDNVRIRVLSSDIANRTIDFVLLDSKSDN
ncbi:MAG: ribonuclease R [Clostridia bacterium BRH_c25]|nr:MAG: ribonuclease R [Clostridia bacterium BRH_c25]